MKVVLVGKIAAEALELMKTYLRTPCQLVPFPGSSKDPAVLNLSADAEVIVGGPFTEVMGRTAQRLRLFQAHSNGMDEHDLSTISPKVTVANARGPEPGIGEYVMMVILALSKRLFWLDSRIRQGSWDGCGTWGDPPLLEELEGKILGLLGFGNIGRDVAARARAFGMKIRAVKKNPAKGRTAGVEFLGGPEDLEKLIRSSDFLVLACPLTEATQGWIKARELGWMKPTAFLINVARGAIVDEKALFETLQHHRIGGAALDVWYRYPSLDRKPCTPSHFAFAELDNVIMTPHLSGWTVESRRRRFAQAAANIDRLAEGKALKNIVRRPNQRR